MVLTILLAVLLSVAGSGLVASTLYYRSQARSGDWRYDDVLNRALGSEAERQRLEDENGYLRRQTEMILARPAVVHMTDQQLQWLTQQIVEAWPKRDKEYVN